MDIREIVVSWICVLVSFSVQTCYAGMIQRQPTYSVITPTRIRPNQRMLISATVLRLESDTFTITSVVKRTNHAGTKTEEICSGSHTFTHPGLYDIDMKTPEEMSSGNYSIKISGYYDTSLSSLIFSNETQLFFENKQVSVFILTSKPYYNRGETVDIRIIPFQRNMLPVSNTLDVRIKDPLGTTLREWFSQHTNIGGVVSLSYKLSKPLPLYGEWTIEVECLNHIYTNNFLIEEWYVPKKFVNVSMPTSVVSNGPGLAGVVDSRYTSMSAVRGNATIRLDILSAASESQQYQPIIRTIDYFEGQADFLFTREEMEAVVGGENSLIGKELKVSGLVRDWWLNDTSSGYQSAIVFSKTIRIRYLEGSVVTFKPDLPFKVHIVAEYGDGSPLPAHNENRTVYLDIIDSRDITGDVSRSQEVMLSTDNSVAEVWLDPGRSINRFSITARYENIQDTRRELVASRYWSPSKTYLHVATTTTNPTVDKFMNFDLTTNTFIDVVYYVIISGGNIIMSDQLEMYTRSKQISVALSQQMIPTAKLVAYLITPDGQVVADGLNFHVQPSFQHQLSAKINRGKDLTFNSVEVSISGEPLAYVALSALEYQLYDLGGRNGLSMDDVMDELYSYDRPQQGNTSIYHTWYRHGEIDGTFTTNTRTYGYDANTTFYYSGLYIFTDANASAVYTSCNRSEGYFPCMDGKSCYNHKDICTGRAECAGDRLDEMGCSNRTTDVTLYKSKHWRTKSIRSHFWLKPGFMWSDQHIKPNGKVNIRFPQITFPTSWVISVLAISREHGLTVLRKPLLFDGKRPFLMRVEAAATAKLYEHVSLSVVLFNNWQEDVDVLVKVLKSPDYDPIDWSRDGNEPIISHSENQILVPVMAHSERQLYIPVMFTHVGKISVKIEALSLLGVMSHTQTIKVDYGGVMETYVTSYQINLLTANSELTPDLKLPVKERVTDLEVRLQNYVPNSPTPHIWVVGDVIGVGFAQEYNNDINGRNLLASPDYNMFNALFSFATNFYTLKTRRSLSSISQDQTNAVIQSLNIGLQRMFTYMNADGSFNMFRWSQEPNAWLTALVLDVLSDIITKIGDLHRQIQIPREPLEHTARWLSTQAGVVTGAMKEFGNVNNKFFESQYHIFVDKVRTPANISLTAACLTALARARPVTSEVLKSVSAAKSAAADYLVSHVRYLDDPFEVAITAHALSAINHARAGDALRRLKEIRRSPTQNDLYWSTMEIPPISRRTFLDSVLLQHSKQIMNVTGYTVSATSYALMSYLLTSQPKNEIEKIQSFLQTQRMNIGGWTASFDTLLAVRALSIYADRDQHRQAYHMDIRLQSDQDRDWSYNIHLDKHNWFIPHKIPTPSWWGSIRAYAKGNGIALLQLRTDVNYEHQHLLRESAADYYDINYSITTSGFNHSHIHYKMCPSWKGPGERSGIAILDFTIPSGYAVPNGGTQKFIRRVAPHTTIRQGESRVPQVTVYFDYLDRTQNNCYEIRAYRKHVVSNITEHHYVKVFDFFEPGIFNQTIIDRVEFSKLTVCLTCGSYQCGYCPFYASAITASSSYSLITVTAFSVLGLLANIIH